MFSAVRSSRPGVPLTPGCVCGPPRVWLRLEAAAVLAAAVVAYAAGGHGWGLFAALFFLPDVSFLGYLLGPRAGARCYNPAHTYAVPVALGLLLRLLGRPLTLPLIWAAHIGFDRTLGYGLKYADAFAHTHLGRLGHPGPPAPAVADSPAFADPSAQ